MFYDAAGKFRFDIGLSIAAEHVRVLPDNSLSVVRAQSGQRYIYPADSAGRYQAPRFGFPGHAEPAEILENGRLELRPAARRVDVFDAQQQPPARRARHVLVEERRQCVTEMEIAVRARREAEDGLHHVGR